MLIQKIRTLKSLMKNSKKQIPVAIICNLSHLGLLKFIPDKIYLKILFYLSLGYKLNLKNPRTYNEKLQWLKIHDRKEEYVTLVDKYRVREHIKNTIGEEYLIPLLGHWNNANEIDTDSLPNQFVLKCNHDSGSVIICKNKANFDFDYAKKRLNILLKQNLFWWGREWPYKTVKPCIIAEKYLSDKSEIGLIDYKFFCFNGDVKCLYVSQGLDNHSTAMMQFFDINFNEIEIERSDYKKFDTRPQKPINFEKMIEFSSLLSQGMPHARVDWYEIDGKLYFGEITFYTCSGFVPFKSKSMDYKLGNLIQLPKL